MELETKNIDYDDLDIIYGLAIDLVEQYEDLSNIDYPKVKNWLRQKIVSCKDEYWAIYYQDKKAGYYHLSESDDMMELDDLYILKEYQGKGLGTAIINGIIKKHSTIFLYVFKKNKRAIALYERIGFRITRDLKTRLIMVYQAK
ncbi:MAG: GNAT family N-acetyltransferase [Erysipelotrichaceae bacterium]|nr:GNAT family N-acetyltransferase [Erysipelotrichaceae bacterium]